MDSLEKSPRPKELSHRAKRAVRIIYLAMAIFILLPIILVWLTGSISY